MTDLDKEPLPVGSKKWVEWDARQWDKVWAMPQEERVARDDEKRTGRINRVVRSHSQKEYAQDKFV